MLFKQFILDKIATGQVTHAFRRWKRPTVKAGDCLKTSVGVLPHSCGEDQGSYCIAGGYRSVLGLTCQRFAAKSTGPIRSTLQPGN